MAATWCHAGRRGGVQSASDRQTGVCVCESGGQTHTRQAACEELVWDVDVSVGELEDHTAPLQTQQTADQQLSCTTQPVYAGRSWMVIYDQSYTALTRYIPVEL